MTAIVLGKENHTGESGTRIGDDFLEDEIERQDVLMQTVKRVFPIVVERWPETTLKVFDKLMIYNGELVLKFKIVIEGTNIKLAEKTLKQAENGLF